MYRLGGSMRLSEERGRSRQTLRYDSRGFLATRNAFGSICNRITILRWSAIGSGKATGPAVVIRTPEDFGKMKAGDILVAPMTTPAWAPLFALAKALLVMCLLLLCPSCKPGTPSSGGRTGLYGKRAPDFRIRGPFGETYSQKSLKGNVLLLQFGTSW